MHNQHVGNHLRFHPGFTNCNCFKNNSVILKEDSMFGIGIPELTILLVIVLVVFGAGKLPAIGAGIGKSIRNFKNAVTESDKNSEEKESQQIAP